MEEFRIAERGWDLSEIDAFLSEEFPNSNEILFLGISDNKDYVVVSVDKIAYEIYSNGDIIKK